MKHTQTTILNILKKVITFVVIGVLAGTTGLAFANEDVRKAIVKKEVKQIKYKNDTLVEKNFADHDFALTLDSVAQTDTHFEVTYSYLTFVLDNDQWVENRVVDVIRVKRDRVENDQDQLMSFLNEELTEFIESEQVKLVRLQDKEKKKDNTKQKEEVTITLLGGLFEFTEVKDAPELELETADAIATTSNSKIVAAETATLVPLGGIKRSLPIQAKTVFLSEPGMLGDGKDTELSLEEFAEDIASADSVEEIENVLGSDQIGDEETEEVINAIEDVSTSTETESVATSTTELATTTTEAEIVATTSEDEIVSTETATTTEEVEGNLLVTGAVEEPVIETEDLLVEEEVVVEPVIIEDEPEVVTELITEPVVVETPVEDTELEEETPTDNIVDSSETI